MTHDAMSWSLQELIVTQYLLINVLFVNVKNIENKFNKKSNQLKVE